MRSKCFYGWITSTFFTHLTLESNKVEARSHLSPHGHQEDSRLRYLAARHLCDTLSNNWSSLIDLALDGYVLNCLQKEAAVCFLMDYWKPLPEDDGCWSQETSGFVSSSLFTKPSWFHLIVSTFFPYPVVKNRRTCPSCSAKISRFISSVWFS